MFSLKFGKYNIIVVAFEIFSIVFGVLIALWVNNYRETAKEERILSKAIQNIEKEVLANKESVKKALEYHIKTNEGLSAIKTNEDVKSFVFSGYRPPVLYDASFETAKSTGVFALMEYEIAAQLNTVYAGQKTVNSLFKLYLEGMILNPEFAMRRDLALARSISFSFNDIIPAEQILLMAYDSLLVKLEGVK